MKKDKKATMKKQLLFLALGILVLASCTTTNNNTTEVLPKPTGTMEGFVALYDEFGNALKSSAGVAVTLDSTPYTATTDSTGKYVLKNIPINASYNFTFSKTGYVTWHYAGFQFLTGGTAPLLTNIGNSNSLGTNTGDYPISTIILNLYPASHTTINALTATVIPNYINFTATIANSSSAYKPSSPIGVVIFASKLKNISPYNPQNQYIIYTTQSSSNPATATGSLYTYNAYGPGIKVYFIAYGYSGYMNNNTNTGNFVLNSYNSLTTCTQVYPYLTAPLAVDSVVTQ